MRLLTVVLVLVFCSVGRADDEPARFGVTVDAKKYPQGTPKETLASVLRAVDDKRFDYLLAHLVEPKFVDDWVKRSGGFKDAVGELETRFDDNPAMLKDFKRFLDKGEWTEDKMTASGTHADTPKIAVNLRKTGDRWFLLNSDTPPTPKK